MFSGARPDITPAQVLALLTFALTELVGLGLVTNHTEKLILGIAGIVIPAALKLADSHLRGKRAIGSGDPGRRHDRQRGCSKDSSVTR